MVEGEPGFGHLLEAVFQRNELIGDHGLDQNAEVRHHLDGLGELFDDRADAREEVARLFVLRAFDITLEFVEVVV